MANVKESYVEIKCIAIAKKQGYTVRKTSYVGIRGCPDRLFLHPIKGLSFWIEFKTDGGKISKLQEYEQDLLKKSGQKVYNCWSVETFIKIMEDENEV